MVAPRIYADFNSIEYLNADKSSATVGLTGYGTLASLSNQKIRLKEGMAVVLYEPNDIEAEGSAHFDRQRIDPAGTGGEWIALIDARNIRACTKAEPEFHRHACFCCGKDLLPHLKAVGQSYTERCPSCGTSVMAPLAPPENAT
jgi:hypothetical protein